MNRILLILSILSFLFSPNISAQTRVVSGKVTAFNEFPLKNVKVEAKKAKSAVKTDSLGFYSIACKKKDRLVFTAEVFDPVTKRVNEKTDSININMIFKEGKQNEEIAIGYGYMDKKDLAYAVSQLTDENNDFANYPDIYSLIEGKFPGVVVQYWPDGARIYVRGVNSTVTDSQALLIVNGQMVNDLSFLSPTSIKSIEILRDSAGNIYGSRGSNGVVLITTK
jgi:TonB-dependent SusC/RagA subfamily outer membrane receptor